MITKQEELTKELLDACIWALDVLLGLDNIIVDTELLEQNACYREIYKQLDGGGYCAVKQLRDVIAKAKSLKE